MRRDLICSLTLLGIAIAYWLLARNIGETSLADEVGPQGMPLIYATALALLAVLLGIDVLLRWWLARATPSSESTDAVSPARRLARASGALAIGVGYVVAAPLIGYPFAAAIVIAAMAAYQGAKLDLRLALAAAIGAAVLFSVFELVLGIPMPAPWNP